MQAFRRVRGRVAPLDRVNVDTDQIIPKQFLKSIERTGFGDNLFDGWRFVDEGAIGKTPNERTINRDFVLNQPQYQDADVLLARRNFGCGSSREHAVWALMEYGFKAVIAPSFADIFFNNSLKNGLLPVVLDESIVEELFALALGSGLELVVDLETQQVVLSDGHAFGFAIDPQSRRKLLDGLDEIGLTLAQADDIRTFEAGYFARRPWLVGRSPAGNER